jgi:hypothetical protein
MTVLTVVMMVEKDRPGKRSESGLQAKILSNAESPGAFKVVEWEPSKNAEYHELREKLGRGGRRKNSARDSRLAEEFLKRRRTGGLSDTALMVNIGGREKLGRSAAIESIKKGCESYVNVYGTPELKEALSQDRISAFGAAKLAYQQRSGKKEQKESGK